MGKHTDSASLLRMVLRCVDDHVGRLIVNAGSKVADASGPRTELVLTSCVSASNRDCRQYEHRLGHAGFSA